MLIIIIVFRLGCDKLVCCLFYCFPKGSVTGCYSSLWGVWTIFHFRLIRSFLLFEFHYVFFISYKKETCYVYHYCILLGFNMLICFSAVFLLFSPKGSVTGCDFPLGSFCYSPVYFLSRMHLHSGYYYYDGGGWMSFHFLVVQVHFVFC